MIKKFNEYIKESSGVIRGDEYLLTIPSFAGTGKSARFESAWWYLNAHAH